MNNLKKQLAELTELVDIIAALDKYGSRPTAKDNYINDKLRLQHTFWKEAQSLSTEIVRRIEEQSANIATQLQALEPNNTTPPRETPIAAKQKTVIDKPVQTIKEEIKPPQPAATEEPQPTYVTNTPTAMKETPKTDTTAHNEHKSEVQTEYIVEQQVKQTPITFVGDSVLLASANKLREVFPNAYVDGEVGRQLYFSTPIVQKLSQQGRLSQTVVFVLGSNGAFSAAQIDSLIQATGNREIFLVTAGYEIKWAKEVNEQLKAAAERYPNVHLIDWGTYAKGHTKQWLFDDEIHPNDTGAAELANLILQEMVKLKLQ